MVSEKEEKKKSCCTRKCCLIAAGISGVVLVVLGGMLVFIFDVAFVAIVESQLVIANNTDTYDAMVAPPPLYLELYLFNCTNADEFLAAAERKEFMKPRFEELGPYVYREELRKENMEFIDTPDTNEELKFTSTGKYYFEPEKSRGKEEDLVTTVNLISVGAPAIVEYGFYVAGDSVTVAQRQAVYRGLNKLINDANSKLLFTKTAKELFFGFEDPLLSAIVNTVEVLGPFPPGTQLPEEFGLFQTMNTSAGWVDYKIYTGKEDYRLMNVVTEYDGMRELDYWFAKECNMINGTDGTTEPAFMNKEDRIYFFVDDLCRSMYATFYAEVDIKGLPGWEYRVPADLFEAPASNPENECWCPDLEMEVCKHDGGLPLTSCQYGAPVFMTSPHFLYAPHYLEFVEGLDPIEEQHSTPLVYEPNTGICLKADKRLQINFYMEPNSHFDILDGTFDTPYAFPVLWLNESYVTSDEDADAAYKLLVVPEQAFSILQIIFCIIGGIMLVGVGYFVIIMMVNKSAKIDDEDSVDSYKQSKRANEYVYANNAVEMRDEVFEDEKKEKVDSDKDDHSYMSLGEGTADADGVPVTAL